MKKPKKINLNEIIDDLKCPKDFKCYKSNFNNLCKAVDIGMESYLVCLDKNPRQCIFSFSFGYEYFCKCPLRVYIAKVMKK